jgi:cob(I)alamin adenosyltransferase
VIYTKTGDSGETGLCNGSRISKADLRIECIGLIDEVNAIIGLAKSFSEKENINKDLEEIQQYLFNVGADLAESKLTITPEFVRILENKIDTYENNLEPLKEFILPGGNKSSAILHHARTTSRRAERNIVKLNKQELVNSTVIIFVNRLSDLLFVMARSANTEKENKWIK